VPEPTPTVPPATITNLVSWLNAAIPTATPSFNELTAVEWMQTLLQDLGYFPLAYAPTQIYDEATVTAVMQYQQFQINEGLLTPPANGELDQSTFDLLFADFEALP